MSEGKKLNAIQAPHVLILHTEPMRTGLARVASQAGRVTVIESDMRFLGASSYHVYLGYSLRPG